MFTSSAGGIMSTWWGKLIGALVFFIFFSLALIKIIIAGIYFNQCSSSPELPVYLVVQGSIDIAGMIFNCGVMITRAMMKNDSGETTALTGDYKQGQQQRQGTSWTKRITLLFFIAGLVWSGVGSKWIYAATEAACDQTLYNFAYAMLTLNWVLLGVGLGGFILYRLYMRSSQPRQ